MPIAAPYSMTLRFDFVKSELASLGMTITRKDGEFKVRRKGAPNGEGYFTTDLNDALDTGREMAKTDSIKARVQKLKDRGFDFETCTFPAANAVDGL